MKESKSRRLMVAVVVLIVVLIVGAAIPVLGYFGLRLQLAVKTKEVSKELPLDAPVKGRDVMDLAVFKPLQNDLGGEFAKAAAERYRQIFVVGKEGEEDLLLPVFQGRERAWEIVDFAPLLARHQAKDLAEILQPYSVELGEVNAFLRRGDAGFRYTEEVDEQSGHKRLVPPPALEVLPQMARVSFLRGVWALEQGDSRAAMVEVEQLLRYAQFFNDRPTHHTLLWQSRVYQLLARLVWEGLARDAWTKPDLVTFQIRLTWQNYLSQANAALRGQVAYHLKNGAAEGRTGLAGYWWDIADGLTYSKNYDEWLEPMLTNDPGAIDRDWLLEVQTLGDQETASGSLLGRVRPSLFLFDLRIILNTQRLITSTHAACALELYRREHGTFPKQLADLKTREVYNDPITPNQLGYRPTEDGGYLLWSVGWNLEDDGGSYGFELDREGNPTSVVNLDRGDWPWNMPRPGAKAP